MGSPRSLGPGIVIAGAARSGTSYLAAVLGAHPDIDAGAVKEPNYFSREHERGPGEYDHWISLLHEHFPADQVLLVPFDVVTRQALDVAALVCEAVGLSPPPVDVAPGAAAHRNEVVEFRNGAIKWTRRLVKRSGAYPWIRRTVGTDRLRRMRSRMTRKVTAEGMDEALATCGPALRGQLSAMHRASQAAVAAGLRAQDARLGLDWATVWERSCPSGD